MIRLMTLLIDPLPQNSTEVDPKQDCSKRFVWDWEVGNCWKNSSYPQIFAT